MPLHIVSPIHRKKRHRKRVGEGELLQISPITITVKKKWSTLNPPFHKLFNLRGTPLCGGGWESGRTEMLEYDNFANTHRNTHLIHIQLRIKQMQKKMEFLKDTQQHLVITKQQMQTNNIHFLSENTHLHVKPCSQADQTDCHTGNTHILFTCSCE